MRYVLTLLVSATLVLVGCSAGPDAPDASPVTEVCSTGFCITVPSGWETEIGETYISAHHALAPDSTFLTAGVINMRAIVENAGGSWPATTEEVARSFWALLEDADAGSFERSSRMIGGAERSWGAHRDGDMWHLVFPTGASSAIGVELRAPNGSWEAHADTVFASVRLR